MNPPTSSAPVSCVNCQAVTTADGKTVWVCERCGEENQATAGESPAVPAEASGVGPEPDAASAQAVVAQAASEVTPAMEATPPSVPNSQS
jgi:hypothetical protein